MKKEFSTPAVESEGGESKPSSVAKRAVASK